MANKWEHDILQPDVFDVLSATWVMVCNDENPIITYEGIIYRMKLKPSFDIRGLIQTRGDLFRRGVLEWRLSAWKDRMLEGKSLPSWISEIQEESLRKKTIMELTTDDVFRCQFRVKADSPQASLEVIDWGLQHIDRLRKANYEARDKSAKSWQMWLVFGASLLNIAATIIAVLLKKP